MIDLYKRDNTNNIRHWSIWYDGDEIVIKHGLHRGAMQEKREKVIVKGNNTLAEQIQSRIASRCSKQRDKGYVNTIEHAEAGPATNQLDMPRPMLAQPITKASVTTDKWFVQFKYDGHRCLIARVGDRVFAYSRNGKEIKTISHIIEQLAPAMIDGMILDGELYIHGLSLQKIASLVKRNQTQSRDLKYMLYDMMDLSTFGTRLGIMQSLFPNHVVATDSQGSFDKEHLDFARANGYEGLIVRLDGTGYEAGKRSKSLIKIKKFEDAEFLIVGVHASVDGWAILECRTTLGKSFNVSAPGSMKQRTEVLNHSWNYIYKWVTVEYSNITKDGIPFHPVAIRFREPE